MYEKVGFRRVESAADQMPMEFEMPWFRQELISE